MSDPFLDAEASRESSHAVELYAIIVSTGQAYYLTSAIRDITYDGRTYTATAIDRGEVAQDTASDARDMELRIAIDHPLVTRWTAYGVPPKRTTVSCTRYQVDAAVAEWWWDGEVTSLAWDDKGMAKLRIPARMGDALARRMPNISVSKTCTHILYDGNCGVSQTGSSPGGLAHRVSTTAIVVDGRNVRVDLAVTGRNGTWSEGGTLKHVASGETMTIGKQTDVSPGTTGVAVLTMQALIVEMKAGDAVIVQRGCRHTPFDCRESFGNVAKFSGYPDLPTANPFKTGELV
jgi:hypothetical protein